MFYMSQSKTEKSKDTVFKLRIDHGKALELLSWPHITYYYSRWRTW